MPNVHHARRFRPSVVAASSGQGAGMVFLTEADIWTADIGQAELIEDEAHGDIRLLEAGYAGGGTSSIRLAAVRIGPTGPEALAQEAECA